MENPKRLWLAQDKKAWQQWRALLEKTGLRTDEPVEYTVGIYEQGQLIATGSYQGKIIKCLAVCKNYQSENLLTSISGTIKSGGPKPSVCIYKARESSDFSFFGFPRNLNDSNDQFHGTRSAFLQSI